MLRQQRCRYRLLLPAYRYADSEASLRIVLPVELTTTLRKTLCCPGLVRTATIILFSGERRALAPQAALFNSSGKRLSTNVVLRGFPPSFLNGNSPSLSR